MSSTSPKIQLIHDIHHLINDYGIPTEKDKKLIRLLEKIDKTANIEGINAHRKEFNKFLQEASSPEGTENRIKTKTEILIEWIRFCLSY